MYGTLEKGFVEYEQWHPAKPAPEFPECHFLGWADYPQPLPFDRIWQWEVVPADRKQYIEYMFWRDADRNDDGYKLLMDEYLSLSDSQLELLVDEMDSFQARLALEYKHAGWKP